MVKTLKTKRKVSEVFFGDDRVAEVIQLGDVKLEIRSVSLISQDNTF